MKIWDIPPFVNGIHQHWSVQAKTRRFISLPQPSPRLLLMWAFTGQVSEPISPTTTLLEAIFHRNAMWSMFFITFGLLHSHSTSLCVLANVRTVDTACFQTWDESLRIFSSFCEPVWLALLLLLAHGSTVINSQMHSICHGFSGWQALTTTACYLLSQMHPVLYQLTDVWLFGTQTGIEFPRMRNYFEMHVTQKSSYLHKICERLLLPWWTAALRILSWIKVIYFLVAEGKMRKRKGPESRPKLSKANCWLANICPVPMQAPPGKCSLPKFWKGGRQHCWIPGWKRSTLYTWLGRRELQECHCSSTPTSGSCFHPFSLHTLQGL